MSPAYTTLPFYKYEGTGNDFILIDGRAHRFTPDPATIATWCDRHKGIGADGMILLRSHPSFDLDILHYNPDGSTGLCGNGARCAVHLARILGFSTQDTLQVRAGQHILRAQDTPTAVSLSWTLQTTLEKCLDGYYADTGSPHFVRLIDESLSTYPLAEEAQQVRQQIGQLHAHNPHFSPHVNVNMARMGTDKALHVRTFENGVGGETLSCGTGAMACAMVMHDRGSTMPLPIRMAGGRLYAKVEKQARDRYLVELRGPVRQVFEGHIPYPAHQHAAKTATQQEAAKCQ